VSSIQYDAFDCRTRKMCVHLKCYAVTGPAGMTPVNNWI